MVLEWSLGHQCSRSGKKWQFTSVVAAEIEVDRLENCNQGKTKSVELDVV